MVHDIVYIKSSKADISSDTHDDTRLTYDCDCNYDYDLSFEIYTSVKVGLHFVKNKKVKRNDVNDYKFHKYIEKLHPCNIINNRRFFMARNNLR